MNDDTANSKRSQLLKWGVIGVVVLLVIMLVFALLMRTNVEQYHMGKTPYSPGSFAHLDGDSLYTYNGIAFLKTDIKTGTVEALSSGEWFPTPKDVKWVGSKGVLIRFSIFFPKIIAEDRVNNLQQRFPNRNAEEYTWYYDFSSRSLKLVNEQPLLTDDATYYSESEDRIYYLSSNRFSGAETDEVDESLKLYFYDLSTGKNTTVNNDLAVTAADTLHACPNLQGVCFIARDTKDILKAKLFQVKPSSDSKPTVLLESTGRIFRTNNPDRYATIEFSRDEGHSHEDHGVAEGEVELTNEPVTLHALSQKKTYNLDFKAGISEPNIHFVDETNFYVLFNNSESADGSMVYRSGVLTEDGSKSKEFEVTYGNKAESVSQLVTINNLSRGESVLVSTIDNEIAIFNAERFADLKPADVTRAKDAVERCASPLGLRTELLADNKMFRIVVNQGGSFSKNISDVSSCIVKSGMEDFRGYTFQFAAINPFSSSVTFY